MPPDLVPLALSGPLPPTPPWQLFVANWLFWIGALLALAIVYRFTCSLWSRMPAAESMSRLSYPRLFLLLFADLGAIAVWCSLFISVFRT